MHAQTVPTMQFDLPAGTMLGKYEILRKLAMGGMAEIYLARVRGTAGFEKLCVIKRILPTVANDPTFVRMFLDEARLAATLQHPNIADVYEVDEHAGSPFFAMEFIHGQDVRAIKRVARERREPVPLAISLAIIHGTASALDYAHDRVGPDGRNLGLVHRDVSSSNVLVSYEGAIKLIDFGIARATSRTSQTQVGTLKGKIPYMSPEQCRGAAIDRRSDLWALGVVLFELTTGRRPFTGENDFAVMDQIVHQPIKTPSALMRNYPPELEGIVMRLLTRNVDERYQSAEELLHDLDPFIAQHRLFVTAKPLSKYMRQVFENEVIAWDSANEDGVTLAAHMISTGTGRSVQSELHTPPSSFPAVMPLSQEMPAVRASEIMRAEPTPMPFPLPNATALRRDATPAPAPAPVYPDVKIRSGGGKKALFALIGLLALGGGGYLGLTLVQKNQAANASASSGEPVDNADPTPEPTGSGAAPQDNPVEPKAGTETEVAQPAAATGSGDVQADNPPDPKTDKANGSGDDPVAVAGGEGSANEEPVADDKSESVKQPKKTPIRRITKRQPKEPKEPKETPKETPKEEPVKKDPPKKDPPKKDPLKKEPWDQDSPFLPGQ